MHQQLKMIEVPEEWVLSGGAGVTVAVIDSYIDVSKSNLNIIKNYSISNCGTYDGSHCLSVCEIIHNVAPNCNIITSQALFSKSGDYAGLIRAISNIENDDIDIVNFSLSSREDKEEIRNKISRLSDKSIIIAAMANDGGISYPAMYKEVLSVSSFKKDNINADIYCPDSFAFGKKTKTGNSMSAAFISGIFALAKSYNKNFTKEDIIKLLLEK